MKLKPGLSLPEVVITLLIVGVSVPAVLTLQGSLSRAVFSSHSIIDRIPYIKSFFAQADRDKLYTRATGQKKIIDEPEMTLNYTVTKPTSKTLKGFDHLVIERVDASWPRLFGQRSETFVMARFMPEAQKEGRKK